MIKLAALRVITVRILLLTLNNELTPLQGRPGKIIDFFATPLIFKYRHFEN